MYFYTNKNEIRCSKKENRKMENVSSTSRKKKRKQLFDTVNGKERDQPLFLYFSIEEVWKGDAQSDVKILRGVIWEANFRKEQNILSNASTVYACMCVCVCVHAQ